MSSEQQQKNTKKHNKQSKFGHYTQGTHKMVIHVYDFFVCRTCIYSLLTKGRPYPFNIMLSGMVFCSINGFLQAHYLLHCVAYQDVWFSGGRFIAGKTWSLNRWLLYSAVHHSQFEHDFYIWSLGRLSKWSKKHSKHISHAKAATVTITAASRCQALKITYSTGTRGERMLKKRDKKRLWTIWVFAKDWCKDIF